MLKTAQSRSGRTLFGDVLSKTERNLAEAKKDNDFIYHERIPDIKSVEPIGKAQPAKVLQISHPMSQNFKGKCVSQKYSFILFLKNIFRFV